MVEPHQEGRLGENHHSAQMVQPDHPKNRFIGPSMALIGVVERIRIDQHLTQPMVLPVVESEDRDRRTRSHQHPNRLVHLRANARDPDLVEKDLHQLPEPCLPHVVEGLEEHDVCEKNPLPLVGKRLLHDRHPPKTPSPHPPVAKWTQSQQDPQRREDPDQQSRRPGHQASSHERLPPIPTIRLRRHDHRRDVQYESAARARIVP